MHFPDRADQYRARVESTLERWIPAENVEPESLHRALRYAVFNGGKRIRPLLTFATAEAIDMAAEDVDPMAAAVELIHCYSLVHDDLPAMDDDDLRRGKPTLHRAFDEATAILAGDALLTLAFEGMARANAPARPSPNWPLRLAPRVWSAVRPWIWHSRQAGPPGIRCKPCSARRPVR